MEFNFSPIYSAQDATVNFVAEQSAGGFIETRFVRRKPEYFIVYLSSQTGCNKGCNFCHLTRTGQTNFTHVSPEGYRKQAEQIYSYYRDLPQEEQNAKTVHYDFMVRGEPLANPSMLQNGFETLYQLSSLAHKEGLIPKFNVSTIMPKETRNIRLAKSFAGIYPTIYYSLYSLDPEFRKKWMPASLNPLKALDVLAEYQQDSKKLIKIHGCIIKGENDQPENWANILEQVKERDLKVDFNLVRYNPYSPEWGEEATEDRMNELNKLISDYTTSKVVSRVGFDVKASCGMFVD